MLEKKAGEILRVVFLLLVFANLIFFAWDQGYLGNTDTGREPQRLSAQLNPGKLRIVSTDKPPASEAAEACRAIGNLRLADAQRLQSSLGQQLSGATITLVRPDTQPNWDIAIAGLANRAAADAKSAELKKLGIDNARVVPDNKTGFAIVLVTLQSDAAAQEQLQALVKKGVKSAKVVARPVTDLSRIFVRGTETAITRLPELTKDFANASLTDCPAK